MQPNPLRLLAWLVALSGLAAAERPLSPAEAGVQIQKPVGDGVTFSHGSGVLLGDGLVLTAAHVVKVDPGHPAVTVVLDGLRLDGQVIAVGDDRLLDLALIKLPVEALPAYRRNAAAVALCTDNPVPGRPVVVASTGTVTATTTVPTAITSDGQTGDWTNLLSTGYHQGASGGGVFDLARGCLWGVIYLELSGPSPTGGPRLDLTAIVPAAKVAPFLDAHRGGR